MKANQVVVCENTVRENPINVAFGGKRDVAKMVGVCNRTVDNWLQCGMPHIKLSRRLVRFDLREVESWLKKQYSVRRQGKEAA
jgi:predicted DNA-binding transcriptional regulator AlpA